MLKEQKQILILQLLVGNTLELIKMKELCIEMNSTINKMPDMSQKRKVQKYFRLLTGTYRMCTKGATNTFSYF